MRVECEGFVFELTLVKDGDQFLVKLPDFLEGAANPNFLGQKSVPIIEHPDGSASFSIPANAFKSAFRKKLRQMRKENERELRKFVATI